MDKIQSFKNRWYLYVLDILTFVLGIYMTNVVVYERSYTVQNTFLTICFIILMFRLFVKELNDVRNLPKSADKRIKSRKKRKPSRFAMIIAGVCQEPEIREYALGCMEERFAKDLKRGLLHAQIMLWWDNLASFNCLIGSKVLKVLKWLGIIHLIEKFFIR